MLSRHRELLLCAVVVAACGSPESPSRRATPAPLAGPIVPPPPTSSPAPAVEQKFAGADPGLAFLDPDRRAKLEAAFPAIERAIGEEMKRQNLPGLAVGIVIDGELAYAKGFGVIGPETKVTPDADTVYRIGSISKSFTGLALLSLRDDGALDLDDPLTKWIPQATGLVYPSTDARAITLRQLATHTSGLPRMGTFDPEHGPSEADIVASLAGLALDNAPGLVSTYSNLGFSLLGIVAAHAGHAPLHDLIKSRIFDPLGMTSTVWSKDDVPAGTLAPAFGPGPDGKVIEPTPLGAADGAGGIYSSVRDMARYAAFQLDAYPPRNAADTAVIKRATRREAHATGFESGGGERLPLESRPGDPLVEFDAMTYGFGWVKNQTCRFDDLVWHNGAIDSYRAELRFLSSRGVGVVALTNFGQSNMSAIAEAAIAELARTGALTPRTAQLAPEFAGAMAKFLEVYNNWDDKAYVAMLDPVRGTVPEEKAEITGYRALHGTCTGFAPREVISPRQAMLTITCERGTFELFVSIAQKSGLIDGFAGTSRDVAAPAEQRKLAEGLAGLIAKWDDRTYKKLLGKTKLNRDTTRSFYASLRTNHGSCKVGAPVHEILNWEFELTCERGGKVLIGLPMQGKELAGFFVHPPRATRCPVR